MSGVYNKAHLSHKSPFPRQIPDASNTTCQYYPEVDMRVELHAVCIQADT